MVQYEVSTVRTVGANDTAVTILDLRVNLLGILSNTLGSVLLQLDNVPPTRSSTSCRLHNL